MNQQELDKVLKLHKKWYNNEVGGQRADLRDVDLGDVDLQNADLRRADLRHVNLRYVNLRNAKLQGAKLQGAKLQGADLRGADLRNADLQGAELQGADLQGADIDFSCLPLWCGGLDFKIDECQAIQLMYHVINLMQYSELDVNKVVKKQMFKWLSDSHLVTKHNLPILEEK